MFADDVAGFLNAMGIGQAHISGLSLGAATGMWLAAKYPEKVKSLSLHSGGPRSDSYIRTVLESWQVLAKTLKSVPETVVSAIFPWCFTPELYTERPEYIQALADFVRSRPAQTVDAFIDHSNAVIAHDAEAQLGRIEAPTLITFGRRDVITSTRFAAPMKNGIRNSELVIFENCSHAPNFERVEEFNTRTLAFLKQHIGSATAAGGAA
jgi:pimeloyl-ACP methyl ester carboxylesterase